MLMVITGIQIEHTNGRLGGALPGQGTDLREREIRVGLWWQKSRISGEEVKLKWTSLVDEGCGGD